MEYTINELSNLAGVSARTLRYYDEIGLLKPLRANEAGYRFYGSEEVDLLQQILFYREQKLPLSKIKSIIYDRNFDSLTALYQHLADLTNQQERISGLICTVNATIASMKGELSMNDKEKFEAFKKNIVSENENQYGCEVRETYGDNAMDESNQKLLNMTEEDYSKFKNLETNLLTALEQAVTSGASPEDESGRQIAMMHKDWLGYTWKSYSACAHQGLVSMYLSDKRFKEYYDRNQKGCTQFLVDAVTPWCK